MIKISVTLHLLNVSPSSRRAWIEIHLYALPCFKRQVALLAEGVDRNTLAGLSPVWPSRSPSSRRAWIEIFTISSARLIPAVALLAEGVDRNMTLPHNVS